MLGMLGWKYSNVFVGKYNYKVKIIFDFLGKDIGKKKVA